MDKILIKNLRARGIIGINDWERVKKQDILINIEIEADLTRAGETDDLAHSVNYRTISKMALELDPGLNAARALLVSSDPETNSSGMAGIRAFETLALAEPDEFYALDAFSWYLLTNGYFQETINLSDRMIELEPLDTESYFRKGEALSAAGRIEEAELAWKRAASLGGRVDTNFYLGVSSLIQGKDDVAITWLEKYFSGLGMNPADVRPLVEQARDPVIGQAAIDAWIDQAMAAQPGTYKRRTPFVLYLGFGYLDAYWAVQDSLQLSPGMWSDTDFLVQEGMVFRASGYCRHPRYLPFAEEDLAVEVWEKRGPPDHCRKVDGRWACE